MTRTQTLSTSTHIALGFTVVLAAMFLFASQAFAKGGHEGGMMGGEQNFQQKGSQQSRTGVLEDRLKNIEDMKMRVQDLLAQIKNGSSTASSTRRDGMRGEHRENEMENHAEDRRDSCGTGTTTAMTTASSTATSTDRHIHKQKGKKMKCGDGMKVRGSEKLMVTNPNGGSRMVNDVKEGILIRWKAPKDMTTVDISFTQEGASSTAETSIAKGVDAHNKVAGIGRKGDKRANGNYLWKGGAVGTGYKIVVSGVSGSTTVSDMSDSTFSIVASRTEK
jgi:hypothetical protein